MYTSSHKTLFTAPETRAEGRAPAFPWTDADNVMADAPPDRLATLRTHARRALRYLLNYMNANAEQFLQGLAMKTPSKVEKADLHMAAREWQIKRPRLEEAFTTAVLAEFDQFVPAPADARGAGAKTDAPFELALEPKGLGLVQDERLEESIAVENLATRALADHREALLAIGRHILQQTGQRRLDPTTLPLAPAVLGRHFFAAVNAVEVIPDARSAFVKLFARFVLDELRPFYAECMSGIEPEPEEDAGDEATDGGDSSLALEELPTGARPDEELDPLAQAAPEILWDITRTPLLAAPGKAMALPRSVLDDVLLGLQRAPVEGGKSLANLNPKAGILPFEVFELVNGALEELGHQKPMALTLEVIEAVNLVRLLFDRVLRDQRLAQPVRRLLRLLQIPVLRAALRDPEVLSSAANPVRVFFAELAEAAIDWTPQGELASDAFFRTLQHAVGRIVTGYGADASVFTGALAELRAAVRSREARIRLLEQHTLIAEIGRMERETARAAVARAVTAALGDAALPRVVGDFLRGAWSDALFVIFLQHGTDSAEWTDALRTTTGLVAVAAKRPGADLAAVAPGVLRALRIFGFGEDEAAAELRGLEQALGSSRPLTPTARERVEPTEEFLHLVDKLAPDTWIEFRLSGHATVRARLLTKFPKTGEFVFVTGEGGKAGNWQRADLAAALQTGEAIVIAGPNAPSTPRRP